MTTVAAMALALSVLAQTPGVGAPAKESAELTVPLYLSCDGITSDQRILKILSNGATWMGACTETTDPALGAKPSPH
jgi:hypothetical protein